MKKLLIISWRFPPDNSISAIRPAKLAKYLSLSSRYEVSVLSAKMPGRAPRDLGEVGEYLSRHMEFREWDIITPTIAAFNRRDRRRAALTSPKPISGASRGGGILAFGAQIIEFLSGLGYASTVIRALKKDPSCTYDIVFSTYNPYSSHAIARYLKKTGRAGFWVADFRDPITANLRSRNSKAIGRAYAARLCRDADVLTAVSTGVFEADDILNEKKKVVVTNGFDTDDLSMVADAVKDEKTLVFAYTGTLYRGRPNMDAFFGVLRELVDEGLVPARSIRIEYAGARGHEFSAQAGRHGLEEIVHDHGFVTRAEALQIQRNAHILLVTSWNDVGNTGIVTGKILEYMMMDKPVVSIVTGNLANSIIKDMTDTCGLGICYEEPAADLDHDKLKDYLRTQYQSFVSTGHIHFAPNPPEIEKYHYRSIVAHLETLFPQ